MLEGNEPIQPEFKEAMNRLGAILNEFLNRGSDRKDIGFCLLVFKYKNQEPINYISNAERSSMVSALRELVSKFDEQIRSEN